MEKKIPMSCNLKFNPANPRHVYAAQVLASIRPKQKTAFVALAVEAYMEAHPAGIDMNELDNVQKVPRRSHLPAVGLARRTKAQPDSSAETREAIREAMDFYEIE